MTIDELRALYSTDRKAYFREYRKLQRAQKVKPKAHKVKPVSPEVSPSVSPDSAPQPKTLSDLLREIEEGT